MFDNPEGQGYVFNAKGKKPNFEAIEEGVSYSEIIANPDILFVPDGLTDPQRYKKHRINREVLVDKEAFLGMGNDGFVVCLGSPEEGNTCIKYVWKKLEVYLKEDADSDFLEEEIKTLHNIAKKFKQIKSITRAYILETGQVNIGTNEPNREAVLQEVAHQILAENGMNCYVPEIIEVDDFHETDDEEENNPNPLFFLDDEYSTIMMQYVPGKSIEDIILKYPETSDYVEAMDVDAIEKDLISALKLLHGQGIKHQDITLRNIMFDIESKKPVIIDFGKSSFGGGDISEEEEMKRLGEVISHLRAFIKSPEQKNKDLSQQLEKKMGKLGI